MSVMNDTEIIDALNTGLISIVPLDKNNIQPASIDLRLHNMIDVVQFSETLEIGQLTKDNLRSSITPIDISEGYELKPNEFVTGYSFEIIKFTSQITGRIFNRNSLARWGLNAAISCFINPGFSGRKVIVIHNFSPVSIILKPEIRICQLEISSLASATTRRFEDRHDITKLGFKEKCHQQPIDNIDNPFSEFLNEQIKIAAGR